MDPRINSLLERRSIRSFKKEMPKKEEIDAVIEVGLYAASARNLQESIILCVTDEENREFFRKANAAILGAPDNDPFYGAPVILVVLGPKHNHNRVYDGSLVIGNMMQAAYDLGLGSCWIHRAREEFETEEFRDFLKAQGVEGEYEGIGHCILGYPDAEHPLPKPRKEDRVF